MQIDMQLKKEMEELKRQRDVAQLQLDEMRRKVHNEQPVWVSHHHHFYYIVVDDQLYLCSDDSLFREWILLIRLALL